MLRRVDKVAHDGRLRPRDENEIWALAVKIASNEAISKLRLLKRVDSNGFGLEESEFLRPIIDRCRSDDEVWVLLHRLVERVRPGDDRTIFLLRMRGAAHELIASELGISTAAARQRWSQIIRGLRAVAPKDLMDEP